MYSQTVPFIDIINLFEKSNLSGKNISIRKTWVITLQKYFYLFPVDRTFSKSEITKSTLIADIRSNEK